MEPTCPICNDVGMIVTERPDGTRLASTCECRIARQAARAVLQSRIPERYRHCTIDNYETMGNASLSKATLTVRNFVKAYPLETDGKGLLLIGSVGLGKTHLAVGLLQELIGRGAKGLFCDYRDLLKQIQDSYGRTDISERQVLAPIFDAEVLFIDELGAAKPTEWVWDTVQHILNTRYNDRKTTIITTNYRNEEETPEGHWEALSAGKRSAAIAMHRETLGDRITERMRSRLQEMCVVVEMTGADFRQTVKRATFA